MVIVDNSIQVMPGKSAEATAALKAFVAYVDDRWPAAAPRQVWIETAGDRGRLHLLVTWESLASMERNNAEQGTDDQRNALAARLVPLSVPGSHRTVHYRTA